MTNRKVQLTKEIEDLRKKLAEADKAGNKPIYGNEDLLALSQLLDEKINEFYNSSDKK